MKDDSHDPSRCPSPRMENTVPKDTSGMPTSLEREGTAGPRALMNTPIIKKEENMATEGASRFASRARAIPLDLQLQVESEGKRQSKPHD